MARERQRKRQNTSPGGIDDVPFEVFLQVLGRDHVLGDLPRLERVPARKDLVDLLERVALGLAEHEPDLRPAGARRVSDLGPKASDTARDSRSHDVERGIEEVDAVSDVVERERSRH